MAEYAVVNPTSGEQLAVYPTITKDELRDTVSAATTAHLSWDWSISERAAAVARVGHLHSERREELAATIVREMGKPVDQALGEVDFCASIYSYYADNAAELMRDESITLLDGEGSALIRRSSLGVLLGIMPWNYPYYQVARFAAPNLVIGNTILLKHAPQCPESAAAHTTNLQRCGVSSGRLQQHLRVPRAGREPDRRSTSPRGFGDGFRACRRGGGGAGG